MLAVRPGLLEGALAKVLSATGLDEVVQLGRDGQARAGGDYDAAVVSIDLPSDIHSDVVITLPDHSGSGGTGTVHTVDGVRQVQIDGPEHVLVLLDEYAPRT